MFVKKQNEENNCFSITVPCRQSHCLENLPVLLLLFFIHYSQVMVGMPVHEENN
jgi:hypothetical protein